MIQNSCHVIRLLNFYGNVIRYVILCWTSSCYSSCYSLKVFELLWFQNHRISYDEYQLLKTVVMNVLRGNDQRLYAVAARESVARYHHKWGWQSQADERIKVCKWDSKNSKIISVRIILQHFFKFTVGLIKSGYLLPNARDPMKVTDL